MRLVPGQRCLIAWAFVLLALIGLVIYLDAYEEYMKIDIKIRKVEDEPKPIFLACILFISDAVFIATIIYASYCFAKNANHKIENLADVWAFIWPRNPYILGQLAVMTCKVVLQILLFARLISNIQIPYFVIFIPFWAILVIILCELTRRLHSIQKSA